MSRLEELIQELCPDGVEYKNISEICETITDYTAAGSFADVAKNVKYINNRVGYAQLIRTTDLKSKFENPEKFIYVDEHAFNYLWRVNLNVEGLVLPNVGNCGEVYYVTPEILPHTNNVLGPNAIWVRSSSVDNRFLFHVFSAAEFQKKLAKIISPTGQTKFNKTNFKALTIPVPPLEVQREIVRILDSFTLLTAELTAELTARKKQYEYYRDELLKLQESIPMVTLKEISTSIYRGAGIKRDQVTEDGIPCVRYGEIYTTYNTWFDECVSHTKEEYVSSPKYFEHGDILFAITGESVEDIAKSIAYVGHDKCLAGGDIVVMKHQQNPRYLAHVLNTSMAKEQKSKGKVKSKVVHSNVPSIEQIRIPLPSLEVQKRYADVLDNFEQICNDLNIGLPAEIEARKKQYEFYRDLLLTFAETGNT
ncbi:MAG: restriction endonuclease subunit S, partial [Candidatus Ruminococcus intestinipullorum]|nr:restriction endonuclease subunit S [Candidatus Ruminococcus intestinipullorum]